MNLPFETSKILIVDDEESNVELLCQTLRHAGCTRLHTTTDPREVLSIYQEFDPDLLLLDLRMPHMDGFAVMDQLGPLVGEQYFPILILTAQQDDDTTLQALSSGGKDFMGKPFNIPELLLRVRNLLEIKLLHDHVRNQNLRLEEKIYERTKVLQMVNEELASFNFTVSHDFQEPLRKIITFGDRLKIEMDGHLSDKGEYYIERMQVSAGRLQTLIDDLLLYSKLERKDSHFEPLDLGKIIEEVVDDLEIQINESDAVVKVGQLPTIEADAPWMRQLFQNLISNALKFHKEGEPPVVIINSRREDRGLWTITVEDNGIGFDEKYAGKIFKPFQRLHGRSEYEGSGIGLAICKKIMERQGGSIRVKSQPQKGTAFFITLPEKQPEPCEDVER